jgi:hypothetical protein
MSHAIRKSPLILVFAYEIYRHSLVASNVISQNPTDLFVNRLSKSKESLAKLIEPVGSLLSAVYFDVDGGKEIDHSDGAYDLKIVLA